jgi:Domain of Unknown Function (DUF1080)
LFLAVAWTVPAAEKIFDFSDGLTNRPNPWPEGFRAVLGGMGAPGEWKVILEDVPSVLSPLTPNAPSVARRPVLAQLSRDRTDERFPILVYDEETYGDFSLAVRFKMVDGVEEQMAGVAFRLQDERNYYYVRASALGNTLAFFKIVDGVRSLPVAVRIPISKGEWHELTIDCRGSKIRAVLNGKASLPEMDDKTFLSGKIGLWTKSDAVSYFTDLRLNYKPREILAQLLLKDALKKYPRLLGLQIFAPSETNQNQLRVVASKDASEVGQPAPERTDEVMAGKGFLYGKERGSISVVLPLHDWNGDRVAAVKVLMDSFIGQTEKNAVGRAYPIVKSMEARVQSLKDLTQ